MIQATHTRGAVFHSVLFEHIPSLSHYFSTRDMQQAGAGVWMPKQVHGTNIVEVDAAMAVDAQTVCVQPVEADAVITAAEGVWIGVRTADCVPVLAVDPVQGVVAAIHAGWRGAVAHIVRQTLQRMIDAYGCYAEDLQVAVGPSISMESFEVGEEVAAQFVAEGFECCVYRRQWSTHGAVVFRKPHVDLWQVVVMEAEAAGLSLSHIDCTPFCTFLHPDTFFSARKEGINTGRNVAAIAWKAS